MANVSTYSFTDVNATINCPGYGSYSIQGEGIGDMTVSKTTDRSVHDVASDGSVMVSKIAGNNGSVSINAQQTSSLHKYLQGLFNYCWQADTSAWTTISMTIENGQDLLLFRRFLCQGAGRAAAEPRTARVVADSVR